jgi:hypothetical protein
MRDSSPTGGALGQVAVQELEMLQAAYGSMQQSQTREQLEFNVRRLHNMYLDTIHGPGGMPELRLPLARSSSGSSAPASPSSGSGGVIRYDSNGRRIQ